MKILKAFLAIALILPAYSYAANTAKLKNNLEKQRVERMKKKAKQERHNTYNSNEYGR